MPALTVLVVEDYADAREIIQLILEGAGYAVITATDGAQALVQAATHRPDAILMDVFMPILDGVEATRRLKADPALRETPVIAYTAKATRAPEWDRLFTAVCLKPCDPDALLRLIDQVLAGRRTSGASAPTIPGPGS
jgi:two-component system cell cycle response regulator DivK